jgi:hypothetical protein
MAGIEINPVEPVRPVSIASRQRPMDLGQGRAHQPPLGRAAPGERIAWHPPEQGKPAVTDIHREVSERRYRDHRPT